MARMTLVGLAARRAVVAAELDKARDAVAVLTASLRQLDAALLRRGVNDITAIEKQRLRLPRRHDQRGPIVRPLLALLRTSSEPLSLRALTLRLMEQRGMDTTDRRLYRNANHQVQMALAGQRRNGVVRLVRGPGTIMLWEIAR